MDIRVRFTDPLVGCSRQSIEEDVEQWLGASGEVVGGGAATDGSWANIDLNVNDQVVAQVGLPTFVNQLRGVLQSAKAPSSTTITAFVGDDVVEEFEVG
jgi:hypothetical protein